MTKDGSLLREFSTDGSIVNATQFTNAPEEIDGIELFGAPLKGYRQPRATDAVYYYAGTVQPPAGEYHIAVNTPVNIIVDMKPIAVNEKTAEIVFDGEPHFVVISALEPVTACE